MRLKHAKTDSHLLSQLISFVGSTALTIGLRWEPSENNETNNNTNNESISNCWETILGQSNLQ